MLHNAVPAPDEVYIKYALDFIPDTAPEAADMVSGRPIWLDVVNGSIYPVFDVLPSEKGTYT